MTHDPVEDDFDQPTIPPQDGSLQRDGGYVDEETVAPTPAANSLFDEATIPPGSDSSLDDATIAPTSTSSGEPEKQPERFGDYELLNEIARGGMGVVYRARQKNLNRIVALKMILAGHLAGDEEVQRFYAEAEAAAKLDHPGIVPIYEVGELDGQHFFSMGFIDGSSLSEMVAERPMEPLEAAAVTARVAEAIGYAHDQGVIHRDLKPANVLMPKRSDSDGSTMRLGSSTKSLGSSLGGSVSRSSIHQFSPRVTDFGLAKQVQGNDELTRSGQILGTPSYMPPEQAAGKIEDIDHRSDIYSIGGILYALITGRPPFHAASQLDTLMQVLQKDPVPPRQLDPNLPPDIETIALKALEKDRKRRYQTAYEMAEDLQRFLAGEPILARSITPLERAWRWAKRKPLVAGLGALAAVLLIIVSIGGPLAAIRQSQLRLLAEQGEDAANLATEQARKATKLEQEAKQAALDANNALTAQKEQAERTLYARTISLAYQAWHDDNVARAEHLLNNSQRKYRDWEWMFIKQLCQGAEQTLRGHVGIPLRMQLSADGDQLVSIGSKAPLPIPDLNCYLWDLETSTVKKKLPYRGFAISSDARLLALEKETDGPLLVHDIESGKDLISIPAHQGGVSWANFSSDAKRLATTGTDHVVRVWSVEDGAKLFEWTEDEEIGSHDVEFSADGRFLYWMTSDGVIEVIDIEQREQVFEYADSALIGTTRSVTLSPDNRSLASVGNGPIHLFDVPSGQKVVSMYGHRGAVLDVDFDPGGRRIASSGVDGTVRVWDAVERRELFRNRGHEFGAIYGVLTVMYSQDGAWILSGGADRTVRTWPADGGDGFPDQSRLATDAGAEVDAAPVAFPDPSQEVDWLIGNRDFVESMVFSSDGTRAATAGKDGKVRVYDAKSGKMQLELSGDDRGVGAVAFSPDGERLAAGDGGINRAEKGKIHVWDLASGEELFVSDEQDGPIAELLFDPTGTVIYCATGSQPVAHRGEVVAWNYEANRNVFRYDGIGGAIGMALHPDGSKLLVSAFTGNPVVLDAKTGDLIKELDVEGDIVSAVAFSPGGKHFATGARSWAVAVWETDTMQKLWERTDHSGIVLGVAFSANGKRVFSTGIDSSTRVWDAESGDMLVDFRGGKYQMFGLSLSPDGKTLASFGEAPFVTLRRLETQPNGGPDSESIANAADRWPVIFQDRFERAELGDQWKLINGTCEIEDGALKGELVAVPGSPVPDFCAVTLQPRTWLPSVCEIEFDIWADQGVIFESKLTDPDQQNALDSLFIASNQPYFNQTHLGASVLVQAAGGFAEVARTGSVPWFQANKKHRVRTVRERGKWQMFIDGKPALEAEVPAKLWVPNFHLQCAFAPEGTQVYFDNLIIRAPNVVNSEVQAAKLESELMEKWKLKPLAIESIEQRTDLSSEVQELAVRYVGFRQEDAEQQLAKASDLVADRETEQEVLGGLISWLQERAKNASEGWRYEQLVAAAQYQVGDFEAARDTLKSCERQYQDENVASHPINMALLALIAEQLGDARRAGLAMGRLGELMRSDFWSTDEDALLWQQKATDQVDVQLSRDTAEAAELEEIKRLTYEPLQRALTRFDTADYFDTFTADAMHLFGRTATANSLDLQVKHEDWLASQEVFYTGAPGLDASVTRNWVSIVISGDQAEVTGEYTWSQGTTKWRWESKLKLRRTDGSWKIHWERRGTTGFVSGGESHVKRPSDWQRLDQDVERTRVTGNDSGLLQQLTIAFRIQEAFELASKMVQDDSPAELWAVLADQAAGVFKREEMIRAGKEAVSKSPGVVASPFVRAFLVLEHLPSEKTDLGSGLNMRIPETMREAPKRDFTIPGGGQILKAWYPTENSAMVAFVSQGDDAKSPQQMVATITAGLEARPDITIHRNEATVVAGAEAIDLIFQGPGEGRTLTPAAGLMKRTVMRWVIMQSKGKTFGLLLSASDSEFDQRNSEFQTLLRYIELTP